MLILNIPFKYIVFDLTIKIHTLKLNINLTKQKKNKTYKKV